MTAKKTKNEKAAAPEEAVVQEQSPTREELLVKLSEAEKKVEEYQDRYVRLLADFDNYKKRMAREKADLLKFCNEEIIKDIVPLIDNLDRALAQACQANDLETFRKGLQMAKDQVLNCLKKHGVEPIEAVGKDFDPHLHEALCQVEGDGKDCNKIKEEFEKGYLLHGRLLKPARVSVTKNKTKEGKADIISNLDKEE